MGHQPVMREEVVEYFKAVKAGVIIDGTLGQGGHSEAILEATPDTVQVVGTDRDNSAVMASRERLIRYKDRFTAIHSSYADLGNYRCCLPHGPIMGFLLDLGLSSVQLETNGRGFSYSDRDSLDMRFDQDSTKPTASDLVNSLSEKELADIIYKYGEERASRRIARAIVSRRKEKSFTDAADLADVVKYSTNWKNLMIHPATRTFQALRIAVNDELDIVNSGLAAAETLLSHDGLLVAISFHSLEDRIVKTFLNNRTGKCQCPPGLPVCQCNSQKIFEILTRRPLTASEEEIAMNPRSRSAKMRCAKRVKNKGESK